MKYIFIGVNWSINLFLLYQIVSNYRLGDFQNTDWKQILLLVAFVIAANLINLGLYRQLKPAFTFFELLISVITILLVWIASFFVYIVLAFFIVISSIEGPLFQN